MKPTSPEVFLVSRPAVDWEGVEAYLAAVGGLEWQQQGREGGISDAETLVEFAGRICYRSWAPGLNPNITRVRTDRHRYLTNLLESGHGSVLEHAQYAFVFHSVSRVFTHELVRHRVGVAISQESLRYVRLTDIGFRVPEALEPLRSEVVKLIESVEAFQQEAAERLGLDKPGVGFAEKKEVTSALRRVAPMGLSTDVLWSANVRALRHVIELRTASSAEQEMRLVFRKVGALMKRECPVLFSDFEEDEGGQWVPRYHKV